MSQPQNTFSLSYLGVRAQRPPNIITRKFDPTATDAQNVTIGDFWINFNPQTPSSAKLWVLLGLAGGIANWVEIINNVGDLLTLTGNTGGPVFPLAGNINILTANSTAVFAGTAHTETLDFGIDNLVLGSKPTPTGVQNAGFGLDSLSDITTGDGNTVMGFAAGQKITTGSRNTGIGRAALIDLVSGDDNTALGDIALTNLTTGIFNTAVGSLSFASITTGTGNTGLGSSSGSACTTGTESNNLYLGNIGVNNESNAIRIGNSSQHLTCYVAGVTGVTVSNPATVVINTATGQLGIGAGSGPSIETITGDSGGAQSPSAGNFNFTGGTTGLTFAGSAATETLTGTLAIAHGGTNSTSFAVTDGTVYYDGTRLATVASTGTAGQVLTSNGPGVAPTFQPSSIGGTVNFPEFITSVSGANTTPMYYAPSSIAGGNSNPSVVTTVSPINATVSGLTLWVINNSSTSNDTLTFYLNGAPTALQVTIPALTTGSFIDSTHSVSVAKGDTYYVTASQTTTGVWNGSIVGLIFNQ